MNTTGKKKLIKSLKPYVQSWLDNADPNGADDTDVGYVGERTVELLAALVVTALELNSEAQAKAIAGGSLSDLNQEQAS